MGKFIEEFYYGTLDLQARSTKQNKAMQKQMKVLMLNEDYRDDFLSVAVLIFKTENTTKHCKRNIFMVK